MRDKYGVTQDSGCYSGTDVLINLLDIRDADELAQAEIEFTAERYRTYQSPQTFIGEFTLFHLRQLHYHLFQDLYSWAGEIRDVDISKGETRFCTYSRIAPEANKLLNTIPHLTETNSRDDIYCKCCRSFL